MIKYLTILSVLLGLAACSDSGQITAAKAENLVEDYLENNALFETGYFNTNKLKLKSDKDQEVITVIQDLEAEGYIETIDKKSRKKWFSSDSVIIITPVLTQKALPYVVKQHKNRTEVKTLVYELDRSQEVNFEKKDGKTAVFHVVLLKNETPFYIFGKDSNPNSDFITRKFKAKYSEEKGWELVN